MTYGLSGACRAGKNPHIEGWRSFASSDPAQIRTWWRQWPDAIPGLPTGPMNGVAVLDLDRHEKDQDGIAAARGLGIDPDTTPYRVETPGGGMHLYFQHVDGLGNSDRHLPEGIDIRAAGGYVIAPGAMLPDWPLSAHRHIAGGCAAPVPRGGDATRAACGRLLRSDRDPRT